MFNGNRGIRTGIQEALLSKPHKGDCDVLGLKQGSVYDKMVAIFDSISNGDADSVKQEMGNLLQFVSDTKESFRLLLEIKREARKTLFVEGNPAFEVLDKKIAELAEERRDTLWRDRELRATGLKTD